MPTLAPPRKLSIALALLATACGGASAKEPTKTPDLPRGTAALPQVEPPPRRYASVDRDTFNRVAVREDLPVYWATDEDKDGAIDPTEVASLLFYGTSQRWVDGAEFTADFDAVYARIVRAAETGKSPPSDPRKALVRQDLDAAMPTLVRTDFRSASSEDRAFVNQMLVVADAVEVLFAKQAAADLFASRVQKDDPESQRLLRRNWAARCVTPGLDKNDQCRATPEPFPATVDVYPNEMQKDLGFCARLEKLPNAKALLDPFVAVREKGGRLEATPYPQAYSMEMSAVARELRAAAALVTKKEEAPLKTYLEAAAQSFVTNDWHPADEAWAKMNATNSKYYARVAPDETYWEPCAHKAGFHFDFALIDSGSLLWQKKLDPLRGDLENEMARLAGAPYKARNVAFHLPDFIDVIANAGESRSALGATVGQSLPNWGVVAREGRGRTVAMSNLYTDPDNLRLRAEKANTLFTKASSAMGAWADSAPDLFTTVLHEAAHNLGPANEYRVGGKSDEQAFGGGLAAMLEELKAQTAALHYIEFLRGRGVIDAELAKKSYLSAIAWALNHIARGMYTDAGQRKAYGQLAAIQIGALIDAKALVYDPAAQAGNGKDQGAFDVKLDAMPAAVEELMKKVAGIKARGDRAAAEALAKRYVDGDIVPQKAIAERVLRFPQVSFVYAVDM